MENRSHAIIAASFLIVFLIGAVLLFFWFESSKPIGKTYAIVTSEAVSGLSEQSQVKFKGISIGRVLNIAFSPQDPTQVRILIGVTEHAYITRATYAELRLKGITGGYYVELKLGKKGKRTPLHTSSDNPARIPLKPSLLSQLSSTGEKSVANVHDIIANVQKILNKQNRRHLSRTVAQLDGATHQLLAAENAMLPALGKLPQLVSSAQHLLASSQQLVAAAKRPVQNATDVEASVKDLSESGQRVTGHLSNVTLPQLDSLATRLQSAARHLDQLSRELAAKPQSLIFGGPKRAPGPGEPGFKPHGGGERNK